MSDKLTALQNIELDELNELMEVLGLEPDGKNFETGEFLPEDTRKHFEIKDLDTLNWAFRKVAALTAAKNEVEQVKKNEIARITNWYDGAKEKHEKSISFFNLIIADYAEKKRAENEKYKGESTPYGKVSFSKRQTEWTYTDEKAIIEALELQGHDELIKTEKSITNKTEMKKVMEVKENVFVSIYGRFLEAATTFNEENGYRLAEGLEYKCAVAKDENEAEYGIIVDISTGEEVKDVFFLEMGVFLNNNQVGGVEVKDVLGKPKVTPEAYS